MIFSDKDLSQRIEQTEARASTDFVKSRLKLFPQSDTQWAEYAGTYAIFDGVDSPLTQTFGLGLFQSITDLELTKIESFFQGFGAPIFHEVSPMADSSLLTLLHERGYRPVELSNVMYRTLAGKNFPAVLNPKISVRIVSQEEADLWGRTSAMGWSSESDIGFDFIYNFGRITASSTNARAFIAEYKGEAIATGMLYIDSDTAFLAGASTVPHGRKLGAQNALLDARLRYASDQGCTIAAMGASPGSQSQRNAEKNDFRIAYTRTKWASRT